MNDFVKEDHTELYETLHMAGVIDWAIDLNGYGGDDISPGPGANIVYPRRASGTRPTRRRAVRLPASSSCRHTR